MAPLEHLNSPRTAFNNRLPDGLKLGASLLVVYPHTTRLSVLDAIADHRSARLTTATGRTLFRPLMLAAVAMVVFAAGSALAGQEATAANQPRNLVIVPGLSDFVPWAAAPYALSVLLVSAAAHELAHGVAARIEDLPVDEAGLDLLLGIPIAAYVKIDEDPLEAASPSSRRRVLAAGVTANLLLLVPALLIYALPGYSVLTTFGTYLAPLVGGRPPTGADVAGLGVLGNTAFWLLFLNANLVVVNVLPVAGLDGGRYLRADLEAVDVVDLAAVRTPVTVIVSVATLVLFVVSLVGPHIWS